MGKLIVLEGIDGSGKATQNALLGRRLEEKGYHPLRVSFPDYDSPSSTLVKMYLGGDICPVAADVNPYAASSFFSVDRYVSFKRDWEAYYKAGRIILADRYTTSNVTHQMEKLPPEQWQDFSDWLYDFEYVKLGLPSPDLVIYLDMHPQVSQRLLEKRYSGNNEKKDLHERSPDYLSHCRTVALFAAHRLGWNVLPCFDGDCLQPLPQQEIARQVYALVENLIL